MKNYMMIVFALLAAVGNALFVTGQKKAAGVENPLIFVGMTAFACVLFFLVAIPFTGGYSGISSTFARNIQWIFMGGAGLFVTFLGFNLLYSQFTASSYVFYAVLSILTTSIFVGVVVFRERLNLLQFLSILTALATVILYSLGSRINS